MLVGPDNGVLLPATWHAGGIAEAYAIDAAKLAAGPPLATFHARDVLAPAAAALACGVEPRSLGRARRPGGRSSRAPYERAHRENGAIVTEVLDIDRFGSLRLGVYAEQIEEFGLDTPRLEVSARSPEIKVPLGADVLGRRRGRAGVHAGLLRAAHARRAARQRRGAVRRRAGRRGPHPPDPSEPAAPPSPGLASARMAEAYSAAVPDREDRR